MSEWPWTRPRTGDNQYLLFSCSRERFSDRNHFFRIQFVPNLTQSESTKYIYVSTWDNRRIPCGVYSKFWLFSPLPVCCYPRQSDFLFRFLSCWHKCKHSGNYFPQHRDFLKWGLYEDMALSWLRSISRIHIHLQDWTQRIWRQENLSTHWLSQSLTFSSFKGRFSHCPLCKSVGMQVWTQLGRKRDEFCSAVTACTRGWGRALPSTLHITDIVTMLHMARAAHCTQGN